jgi:hypothetical protein
MQKIHCLFVLLAELGECGAATTLVGLLISYPVPYGAQQFADVGPAWGTRSLGCREVW